LKLTIIEAIKLINTKKKIGYLILLFLISASTFQIFNMNMTKNFKDGNNLEQVHTSAQESYKKQWIENPNFTSGIDSWYNKTEGDNSDIKATFNDGAANYEVLGDIDTYSLVSDPPDTSWTEVDNPNFPNHPDTDEIRAGGLYVSHQWSDLTGIHQPSVHWDQNLTMPVDMTDYIIVSANISAVVNATVGLDLDRLGDIESRDNLQGSMDTIGVGDYIRFYILISDLAKNKVYEVGYLQPDLGGGEPGPGHPTETMGNTYLLTVSEPELIFFLTSVLSTDNSNFTVTLGIRLNIEDNNSGTYDQDTFDDIWINYFNLTFAYEKKINQQTSMSWNQDGDKISENIPINYTSFEVTKTILNFKYKINDTWPSSSPNSEIRIFINNYKHTETIKLSTATKNFENASSDGFDVTSLISNDVNLSIQVFLADEFELNRTIAISIDNISLYVSYTVFFDDYQTNLQLFLNGENKTLSPSTELPIGRNLTITVKYTNQTGGHIPGAMVQLTGQGISENLKDYADNYSITFNVTQELSMGINYLNIEATKTNYQTEIINPTITVRKINTEIITVSGESNINIDEGENAQLEIMLNDTDNDELIKGAIVTYTWNLDPIPRVLTENNGIYEGEIEDPPEGLYTITISVFAGEDYEFEDLEITLNVGAYVPGTQPDLGWLIYILIGAILGLVLIFTLYQTHFKYPPMVRKIRKLKKKVRKTKKTKQILVNTREQLIKDNRENRMKDLNLENIQLEDGGKIEKIKSNIKEEN